MPEQERAAVVEAVAQRIAETYGIPAFAPDADNVRTGPAADAAARAGGSATDGAAKGSSSREGSATEVKVVHPPVQREGYVEQVVATYGVKPTPTRVPKDAAKKAARKSAGGRSA